VKTTHLVRVFYTVVLATALGGSVSAAATWIGVDWRIAALPIAAIELGGVVLMRHAEERRELGERAFAAMALSFAFATTAVATNVFGHATVGLSAFFGGMSGLGYLVYLLISSAKRRDALRAAGKLEDTPPAYGVWQWLRHPGVTRRARALAQANAATRLAEGDQSTTAPLGRGASLAAAREQVRAERRQAAISKALDGLIRSAAGPVMADIAVHTYDLDQVAARIADRADYDGLTALLAADLTPARLARRDEQRPAPVLDDGLTALVDVVAPTVGTTPAPASRPATDRPRWRPSVARRPRRMAARQPAITVTVVAPDRASRPATTPATDGRSKPAKKAASRPATTADAVAAALAKKPAMTQADVAAALNLGERTVRRYWPKQTATVNGHDPARRSDR
jgi:hypothetical protein